MGDTKTVRPFALKGHGSIAHSASPHGILTRSLFEHYQFSCDVTAAMMMYRTVAKKVFWEFDSVIMQNLSDILPMFSTPTWPSYHETEKQELNCREA